MAMHGVTTDTARPVSMPNAQLACMLYHSLQVELWLAEELEWVPRHQGSAWGCTHHHAQAPYYAHHVHMLDLIILLLK